MVRINIINPKNLADQHLIAEYLEILMLIEHARKYPKIENIPKDYCLGKGHITFFKNKLLYLKNRHELIKKEMESRGFKHAKTLSLKDFDKSQINDWHPKEKDKKIIRKRLTEKIKKKNNYYRYYKKPRTQSFLIKLVKEA